MQTYDDLFEDIKMNAISDIAVMDIITQESVENQQGFSFINN
jgi:hypothetical protein